MHVGIYSAIIIISNLQLPQTLIFHLPLTKLTHALFQYTAQYVLLTGGYNLMPPTFLHFSPLVGSLLAHFPKL